MKKLILKSYLIKFKAVIVSELCECGNPGKLQANVSVATSLDHHSRAKALLRDDKIWYKFHYFVMII